MESDGEKAWCVECSQELEQEEIDVNEAVDAFDEENGQDARDGWVCFCCKGS